MTTSSKVDNYFRVGFRVFTFDGGSKESVKDAWYAARELSDGAQIVAWQPARIRGPWDRAPLVGVSHV